MSYACILLPSLLGSSDQVECVMDEVEKYMMTRLYKEVFCPETTDDEKKDLAIQKRIRFGEKSHNNAFIFCAGSHYCPFISVSTTKHSCRSNYYHS